MIHLPFGARPPGRCELLLLGICPVWDFLVPNHDYLRYANKTSGRISGRMHVQILVNVMQFFHWIFYIQFIFSLDRNYM